MSDLKPCPCGEVPERLFIRRMVGDWVLVCGVCCGKWIVGFNPLDNHLDFTSGKAMADAREAWNNAPRKE